MESRQNIMVGCSNCGAKNRIPKHRMNERAICGRCGKPLSLDARYPEFPVTINDQSFTREVLNFPGPVVVYYWAPSCPYCPTMTSFIDQFSTDYSGRIKFTKMMLGQNPITGSRYDVQGVPTLLLFKKGREVGRLAGAQPRSEIERQLRLLL
jgi:thioredoxin 2